MITSTTTSAAKIKKTARRPSPFSLGLAVTIVMVIAATAGLLMVALSTVATA